MEAVREFLPFMPAGAGAIIYPLSILFFGCMAYGCYWRFQRYGVSLRDAWNEVRGDAEESGLARLKQVIRQALLQKKVLRRPFAGVFHGGIFFAMLALTLGTMIVALQQDLLGKLGLTVLKDGVYFAFEFLLDTAALAFVAGCLAALGRRLFAKPDDLENSAESYAVLGLLLFIGVTGLLLEGMRLAAHPVPWGFWSYVGSAVALAVPAAAVPMIYPAIWWTHLFAALTMIALVPFTKLYHIIAIPVNVFLEPVGTAKAKLSMPFNLMEMAEDDDEEPTMGVGRVQEFDWKRKFAVDACVNCGRCESVCPAHAAGRELSPRLMIQGLKASLAATVPTPALMKKAEASDLILDENEVPTKAGTDGDIFADGVLSEEAAWSCVNCGACMEECPASIHHVEYLLDLRRHLFSEGRVKDKQATLLEAVDRNGNPYGLPSYERTEWLLDKGIPDIEDNPDADYIYWIGCAGAYGIRNQEVTLATLRLLKAAGLNFAILAEEKCCGEVVKRLGEEGRFQLLAAENVEYLTPYADKTFITSCPHCYNTLKHEYRDFGLELNVVHHTERTISVCMGFFQAFTYAEISGLFPNKSGGASVYGSVGWLPYSKFVAPLSVWCNWIAWTPILAIGTGLMAGYLLTSLFPADSAIMTWQYTLADLGFISDGLTLRLNSRFFLGAIFLTAIFIAQYFGISKAAKITMFLSLVGLLPLLACSLIPIFQGKVDFANFAPYVPVNGAWDFEGIGIFLGGMYVAAWTTYAFETCVCYTKEFKHPKKDAPKSLILSGLLCIFMFSIVPFVFEGVLGTEALSAPDIVDGTGVARAMGNMLGAGSAVTHIIVVMLLFSIILAVMTSMAGSSRTLYQASVDGWLPRYQDHGVFPTSTAEAEEDGAAHKRCGILPYLAIGAAVCTAYGFYHLFS